MIYPFHYIKYKIQKIHRAFSLLSTTSNTFVNISTLFWLTLYIIDLIISLLLNFDFNSNYIYILMNNTFLKAINDVKRQKEKEEKKKTTAEEKEEKEEK